MPSTQEIVGHLQSANQKVSDAMQVLQAAANSAGQMAQTQAGMGVPAKAGEYSQLKEAINKVANARREAADPRKRKWHPHVSRSVAYAPIAGGIAGAIVMWRHPDSGSAALATTITGFATAGVQTFWVRLQDRWRNKRRGDQ